MSKFAQSLADLDTEELMRMYTDIGAELSRRYGAAKRGQVERAAIAAVSSSNKTTLQE